MIDRIFLSYIGAIGFPIILLPLAMIWILGGHSLMYVSLFASPIGLILGLSYSDKRKKFTKNANVIRTSIGLGIYVLFFVLMGFLSKLFDFIFLKNQGWLLIVFLGPLCSALASEKLLKNKNQIT